MNAWILKTALAAVTLIGLGFWAPASQLDPSDDFGFSMDESVRWFPLHGVSVRSMENDQILQVLNDRVKNYPRDQLAWLAQHIASLCRLHDFEPGWVLSLIEVESRFNVRAKSNRGAFGLMQIKLATAQAVAKKLGITFFGEQTLLNPFMNVTLGLAYLAELRDRYRFNMPYFHLAAYNVGPGKFNQLRGSGRLTPVMTRKYYQKIRSEYSKIRYTQLRQKSI